MAKPSTHMKIFLKLFGNPEQKDALLQAELDHINFQIKNGYGANQEKLRKQQKKLLDKLGMPAADASHH